MNLPFPPGMWSLIIQVSSQNSMHNFLLRFEVKLSDLAVQEQQVKRDRSAQIADHRRLTNAVDRCSLCFSSSSRPRHLTISLGQTAYLALPAR